jgi:ribosomal-protein-alanine N-acetyltransferase
LSFTLLQKFINRRPATTSFILETGRIKIIPLSYPQLVTYLRAGNKLEDEFGLTRTGRTISEDVKDLVESFTLPTMKYANDYTYFFYTFWIVIDKASNSIVAELGFKGMPNRNGQIEIGYGTMPDQQGKGFMTDAVALMVKWAGTKPEVRCILAETDEQNFASIRVVQKNGFEQFDKRDRMLWWRKLVAVTENNSQAVK